MKNQYAYSTDGEGYTGKYDSHEEALAEAQNDYPDCSTFWIGTIQPPPPPEDFWCAEDWIEHVCVQDEYCHEWAEGWCDASNSQFEELEAEIRPILAAWIKKNGFTPNHYTVTDSKMYEVEGGKSNE